MTVKVSCGEELGGNVVFNYFDIHNNLQIFILFYFKQLVVFRLLHKFNTALFKGRSCRRDNGMDLHRTQLNTVFDQLQNQVLIGLHQGLLWDRTPPINHHWFTFFERWFDWLTEPQHLTMLFVLNCLLKDEKCLLNIVPKSKWKGKRNSFVQLTVAPLLVCKVCGQQLQRWQMCENIWRGCKRCLT